MRDKYRVSERKTVCSSGKEGSGNFAGVLQGRDDKAGDFIDGGRARRRINEKIDRYKFKYEKGDGI